MSVRYSTVIDRFIRSGEVPPLVLTDGQEPLLACVVQTMQDEEIRLGVRGDRVKERIFRDEMMQFITECEEKEAFRRKCLPPHYDPEAAALQYAGDVAQRREAHHPLMMLKLRQIPIYLKRCNVSDLDFFQAWNLMGGYWNEVLFEQARRLVRLQHDFPQLLDIARYMGREADTEGQDRMRADTGVSMSLDHASHSDIEGFTLGNDLTALLPNELALSADSDTSDLFTLRYATRSLQMFRSRSDLLKPTRRLTEKNARREGPMVVVLDTSASMDGQPLETGYSLVVRLLEYAIARKRALFLVSFAVAAHPIDCVQEKGKLLRQMRQRADGHTDVSEALDIVFDLLEKNPAYMGADVALVSDFQVPVVEKKKQGVWRRLQEAGTRFYGLQLGMMEHSRWRALCDKYWVIDYHFKMSRYNFVPES